MLRLIDRDWTLELLPEIGGAVARLAWRGIEILRPMPASQVPAPIDAVRHTCAYPLLPWSNRIRDGQLHWRGAVYPLATNSPLDTRDSPHPIHGIGWQQRWQVIAHDSRHAALGYEFAARGAEAQSWPFAHRGRQDFTLAGNTLTLDLALTSTVASSVALAGAVALTVPSTGSSKTNSPAPIEVPGGLGWHPFFVAEADAELFCPVRAHWLADDQRLPIRPEPVPAAWHFPHRAQRVSSLVLDSGFAEWSGHAQLRRPAAGVIVTIAATLPLRHLVLFRRADAPWIAIEPVSHMTDAFNRADAGETGTGTQALAAGATLAARITLTCRVAHSDGAKADMR